MRCVGDKGINMIEGTGSSDTGGRNTCVSGQPAGLFIEDDPSLAHLLLSKGFKVRDFVLLPFVAERGADNYSACESRRHRSS